MTRTQRAQVVELERLERDARESVASPGCETYEKTFARAVLAMLPVVRAAEAWHRVNTGMHTNGPQHTLAMRDTRKALVDAIDALHDETRKG